MEDHVGSGRGHDVLSFLAEWFDPLPQITKQYLLKYFVRSNEVEMVELKTRRLFLKRSPCPQHFSAKEFVLGNKAPLYFHAAEDNAEILNGIHRLRSLSRVVVVEGYQEVILYGRDLVILSYADNPTEAALSPQAESAAFLIGPGEDRSAMGAILDEIITGTKGSLAKLRSVLLQKEEAVEVAQCLGLEGQAAQDAAKAFNCSSNGGDYVVFAVVRGSNIGTLGKKVCDGLGARLGGDGEKLHVWWAGSSKGAEDLEGMLTPRNPVATRRRGKSSATLDGCTCCVIKPHVVKAGKAAKIIDRILSEGYEITAVEMFRLDRGQAKEFLEVYQGVIPNFAEMVDEMTTGPCIALEVRGQDVVPRFRETAGPWDVDMAKELRPNSIRGMFGETGARTGVHCTDLAEDGPLESRYFFELMPSGVE